MHTMLSKLIKVRFMLTVLHNASHIFLGRQWLRSGFKVLILNTRLGSRGRTVGQIIERTINKTKGAENYLISLPHFDKYSTDNERLLSILVYLVHCI